MNEGGDMLNRHHFILLPPSLRPFAPLRELILTRMITTSIFTQRRKGRECRDVIYMVSPHRVRLDGHFAWQVRTHGRAS